LHPRQSLTSNTIATFKVRLVLGEVHCSPSQGALLQNPSALIERSQDNIFIEIINGTTDIEGLVRLEGNVLSLWPWTEKAISLIASATSGNYAVRTTVYVFHSHRLIRKVAIWTLYYTYRVDPEVSDFQIACAIDCILEGFWQIIVRNHFFEPGDIVASIAFVIAKSDERFVCVCVTPRVRECDITRTLDGIVSCLYKSKSRILQSTNIDQSCRKFWGLLRLTAYMAFIAIFEPFFGEVEEHVGRWFLQMWKLRSSDLNSNGRGKL
jgi:hypothetical protein